MMRRQAKFASLDAGKFSQDSPRFATNGLALAAVCRRDHQFAANLLK
jgi:hypothetical protein